MAASRMQVDSQPIREPMQEERNADIHSNGGGDVDESFSEHSSPARLVSQISDPDSLSRDALYTVQPWDCEEIFNRKSRVYHNVPETVTERIQEKLKTYLSMLGNAEADEKQSNTNVIKLQWKRLSTRKKPEHKDLNLSAYQSQIGGKAYDTEDKKYSIIRSEATLPYPAKLIFSTVADKSKRMKYETNIQSAERVKQYNHHTSLDYYASMAVWPAAAREFIVVSHWQVITRDDGEKAIIMISFSCPEADSARPVAPNHVRAFLLVSMYIIRDIGEDKTRLTRLLSYDLSGNFSQQLSNVVLMQQADVPAAIVDYLKKAEPGPFESCLPISGLLSNEDVIENVIKRRSGFVESDEVVEST